MMEDIKPDIHQLSVSPPAIPAPTLPSIPHSISVPIVSQPLHTPTTHSTAPQPIPPSRNVPASGASDSGRATREVPKTLSWPQTHPSDLSSSSRPSVHAFPRPPPQYRSTLSLSPQVERAPRWATATPSSSKPPPGLTPAGYSGLLTTQPLASSSQPIVRSTNANPLGRAQTAPHGFVPDNQAPHTSRGCSSRPTFGCPPYRTNSIPQASGSTHSPASTYVTADDSQGSRPLPSVSPLALSGQPLPLRTPSFPDLPRKTSTSSQVRFGEQSVPVLVGSRTSASPISPITASAPPANTKMLAIARERLQQSISSSSKDSLDITASLEAERIGSATEALATSIDVSDRGLADVAARGSDIRNMLSGRAGSTVRADGAAGATDILPESGAQQSVQARNASAQRGQVVVAEIKSSIANLTLQLENVKASIQSLPTHEDLHRLQTEINTPVSDHQTALSAWWTQSRNQEAEHASKLDNLPRRSELIALETRLMTSLVPGAAFEDMRSDLEAQMSGLRINVDQWCKEMSDEAAAHSRRIDQIQDAQQSHHQSILTRLDQLGNSFSTIVPSVDILATQSQHSTSLSNLESHLDSLSKQIAELSNEQTLTLNREALLTTLQPILDKQSVLVTAQTSLATELNDIRKAIPPPVDIQKEIKRGLDAFFSQFEGPAAKGKTAPLKTSPAAETCPVSPSQHHEDPQKPMLKPTLDVPKSFAKATMLSAFGEDEDEDLSGLEEPLFDESLGFDIPDNFPQSSNNSEVYHRGIDPNEVKWRHGLSVNETGQEGSSPGSRNPGQSRSVTNAVPEPSLALDVIENTDVLGQDWDMNEMAGEREKGNEKDDNGTADPSPSPFPDVPHDVPERRTFPSSQNVSPPTPPPETGSPIKSATQIKKPFIKSEERPTAIPLRLPSSRQRSITARLDPSPSKYPQTTKRSASILTQDSKDSKPSLGSLKKRKTIGTRAQSDPKRLAKSDGKARGQGVWPKRGLNSEVGLLQTVACGVCLGMAHWACAGFKDDEPGPTGEWTCPDCDAALKANTSHDDIPLAPQDRCIRGSCVRRANQKIQPEAGPKAYIVERIIGRRAVSRNEDGSRKFESLVLWYGYPLKESTWEPDANLEPHKDSLLAEYNVERERQGIDSKPKVVLLDEAAKCFNVDGNRKG